MEKRPSDVVAPRRRRRSRWRRSREEQQHGRDALGMVDRLMVMRLSSCAHRSRPGQDAQRGRQTVADVWLALLVATAVSGLDGPETVTLVEATSARIDGGRPRPCRPWLRRRPRHPWHAARGCRDDGHSRPAILKESQIDPRLVPCSAGCSIPGPPLLVCPSSMQHSGWTMLLTPSPGSQPRSWSPPAARPTRTTTAPPPSCPTHPRRRSEQADLLSRRPATHHE